VSRRKDGKNSTQEKGTKEKIFNYLLIKQITREINLMSAVFQINPLRGIRKLSTLYS